MTKPRYTEYDERSFNDMLRKCGSPLFSLNIDNVQWKVVRKGEQDIIVSAAIIEVKNWTIVKIEPDQHYLYQQGLAVRECVPLLYVISYLSDETITKEVDGYTTILTKIEIPFEHPMLYVIPGNFYAVSQLQSIDGKWMTIKQFSQFLFKLHGKDWYSYQYLEDEHTGELICNLPDTPPAEEYVLPKILI